MREGRGEGDQYECLGLSRVDLSHNTGMVVLTSLGYRRDGSPHVVRRGQSVY